MIDIVSLEGVDDLHSLTYIVCPEGVEIQHVFGP